MTAVKLRPVPFNHSSKTVLEKNRKIKGQRCTELAPVSLYFVFAAPAQELWAQWQGLYTIIAIFSVLVT